MRQKVIILEDKSDRLAAMVAALREIAHDVEVVSTDNVDDFSHRFSQVRPVSLICLDHDLGPARIVGGSIRDPGDGRDAARVLTHHTACCPVIIHSTNVAGAGSMRRILMDAGWDVRSVVPYGHLEWIEQQWRPLVSIVLRQS